MPETEIISDLELGAIIKRLLSKESRMANWKFYPYYQISQMMMLLLIYYLGLRPTEAALVEISHINFKDKTLFIPAKNTKYPDNNTLPIPDFLFDKLIAYLKVRQKYFHSNIYLFPSYRGKTQDRYAISTKIRNIMKELRISQLSWIDKSGYKRMNKNLYSLRHSFGTRCQTKLNDIYSTAIMMRHKDIRSSVRYIKLSMKEKRKEFIDKIYCFN